MRISIRHHTEYTYAEPVSLGPHVVRLRPRGDAAVRLVDFALDVEPAPVVRADNLDAAGNVVTQVWFPGRRTSGLRIGMRATVETLRSDPFRFLLAGPDPSLPCEYAPEQAPVLAPYRSAEAAPPEVRALALDVARAAEGDPARFPLALAQRLGRDFTRETRPQGPPRPPAETIAARRGACRDLAVLFVACCREQGFAARFASGYAVPEEGAGDELHAWGEAYLDGGGWRGYDPSLGLAVADRHVAVAAAAHPRDAAPVSGAFGGAAAARLDVEVDVRAG